jgi:hypothetical protein
MIEEHISWRRDSWLSPVYALLTIPRVAAGEPRNLLPVIILNIGKAVRLQVHL